jgi:hypothetical protein
MGVPQGVPKEALRYKKTKRPPASARPWNIHPASAFKQHPSKELQNALSQANTAAHPYAEFVNITKTKAIQPAKQRERIETASIERASNCVTAGGNRRPP